MPSGSPGGNDDAGNDGGGNSKRTRATATAAAAGGGGAGDERNKRFGALLFGHIKKAKTTLERDATLIEKRKTVENKLAAEQEKLASTLHQMERKMAEDERSERAKHAVQVRLDALKRRQVVVQAAGQALKAKLLPLAPPTATATIFWLLAANTVIEPPFTSSLESEMSALTAFTSVDWLSSRFPPM